MLLRRVSIPVGLAVMATALTVFTGSASATPGSDDPALDPPPGAGAEDPEATTDEDLVTFGIGPASGDSADQRPYITYGVAPGAVVFDSIAVINQSDQPLDLLVYAADGVTAEGGGLDVRERADASTDLGSWVTIAEEAGPVAVSVPPQSDETGRGEVVLPIQIAVPQNATPGDHIGGVVASLVTVGENPESQNIELEQRVASRIYVRVDGPLEPGLDVEVLDVVYRPGSNLWESGSAEVSFRVTNTGNTRLGVAPSVRIGGPFGLGEVTASPAVVEELVPNGGSATLTTTVPDVRPLVRMTATVDLAARAAPGAEEFDVAASGQRSFWALHWQYLVVLALILIVTAIVLLRRRRRRRAGRSAASHDDAGPDTAASSAPPPYATA